MRNAFVGEGVYTRRMQLYIDGVELVVVALLTCPLLWEWQRVLDDGDDEDQQGV